MDPELYFKQQAHLQFEVRSLFGIFPEDNAVLQENHGWVILEVDCSYFKHMETPNFSGPVIVKT